MRDYRVRRHHSYPLPEEPVDLAQADDELVHVLAGRVDVEAGPAGGRQVEPLVERHRAVVAGPDCDAEPIEHLGHVVGWAPGMLNGMTPPRSSAEPRVGIQLQSVEIGAAMRRSPRP